jgi:hypothetical protein
MSGMILKPEMLSFGWFRMHLFNRASKYSVYKVKCHKSLRSAPAGFLDFLRTYGFVHTAVEA